MIVTDARFLMCILLRDNIFKQLAVYVLMTVFFVFFIAAQVISIIIANSLKMPLKVFVLFRTTFFIRFVFISKKSVLVPTLNSRFTHN